MSSDAAGCYKVAEQIVDQGADYVLALKANHAQLFDELNWPFSYHLAQAVPMSKAETCDGAPGPEERSCWLIKDFSYLEHAKCGLADWKQLASVIVATQVTREGKQTNGRRFFLTSHEYTASQALERVRQHWSKRKPAALSS